MGRCRTTFAKGADQLYAITGGDCEKARGIETMERRTNSNQAENARIRELICRFPELKSVPLLVCVNPGMIRKSIWIMLMMVATTTVAQPVMDVDDAITEHNFMPNELTYYIDETN